MRHSPFNIHYSTLAKLLLLALIFLSYRQLPSRPFVADDFEWLLNVRGLNLSGVMLRGFDPTAQHHFYRPLVWLLLWAEYQLFGLNPIPYHLVSLALHSANVLLLLRLFGLMVKHIGGETQNIASLPHSSFILHPSSLFAAAIFALHPAPFESVVWISAQSELLGAYFLLLTLNLWLGRYHFSHAKPRSTQSLLEDRSGTLAADWKGPFSLNQWYLGKGGWLSVISLGLALLSKESTIMALVLMPLLRPAWRSLIAHYLLGAAYVLLQLFVGKQNSVLQAGEYGIGLHIIMNPLRSLALLVAPLPNTEHADAAWLVPCGTVLALILLILAVHALLRGGQAWRWVLILGLTLAPTAPFLSPPDSRYLYVPVAMLALGLAFMGGCLKNTFTTRAPRHQFHNVRVELASFFPSRSQTVASEHDISRDKQDAHISKNDVRNTHKLSAISYRLLAILVLVLWAGYASGELAAREGRFATANGPGGSLWHLATSICADVHPKHMLLVDAPLAASHAIAIVQLTCPNTQPILVSRASLEQRLQPESVIVAFPGGSAQIESWR